MNLPLVTCPRCLKSYDCDGGAYFQCSCNPLPFSVAGNPKKDDVIKQPKHYTSGSIECWDYITSQNLGYLEGNIIKYVTRYRHKNGLEDLKKAQAYLERLIKEVTK